MVKAIINISNDVNQILNIVKAKYNLKDKSQAIERVVLEFGEELMEPNIKPNYVKKIKTISKGKKVSFSNVSDLKKRYNV